ncbi:conjugal transfer protein TraQ [Proteus mirabilis]|uniref:conjugal transfer protein TraQ n=1 Tax=Proteus mirabilis TaxID=584 RepID=UPI001A2FC051|nr:conjugal transfer protein TraQ [Proteus mirabilis]HEM8286023.1 conjugal transfer protein TraQ [Providencia stuartii]EKU3803939.1 conjugal transfer protein TraQ [Proteus mirabilis]EKV7963182.1 conjugal transfer protein TraQ [Proteus mirabilis]ELB1171911.1 conjugal transfer protein TraQ [Proteus mirabilis]ELB2631270.1 conjugal transfer protein TraQ [Proteus mirabilis]
MNLDIDSILNNIGEHAPLIVISIFALASVAGILGTINFILTAKRQAINMHSMRMGRIMLGIFSATFLISLPEFISQVGSGLSLGYGDINYGVPNVASKAMYGYGADVINSALAIARVIGVIFTYGGVREIADSNLDGNTDLSSAKARSKGLIKIICGVLLIFNPEIIESLE